MENHFVESLFGEYYISSSDPDSIQEVGEDSGNGDTILFTFDDEDMDEPFKSFGKYLTKDLIFFREELLERLEKYYAEEVGVYAALTEIACDSIYYIDTNKDMLRSLLEEKKIDKELCDKLVTYLDSQLRKELNYFKNIDKVSLVANIENRKKRKEK